MISRKLQKSDWSTIQQWWSNWPEWEAPPRDFLPDDGSSGLIIEKDNKPIVAGFIYLTNSKVALLEWVISDPKYRSEDRHDAINLLIEKSEKLIKDIGYKYMFTVTKHKGLINKHKKLGWKLDEKPSYELTKIL